MSQIPYEHRGPQQGSILEKESFQENLKEIDRLGSRCKWLNQCQERVETELKDLDDLYPEWKPPLNLRVKGLLWLQFLKIPLIYTLDLILCGFALEFLTQGSAYQVSVYLIPALIIGLDLFIGVSLHTAQSTRKKSHARKPYPWGWFIIAAAFTLTVPMLVWATYAASPDTSVFLQIPLLLLSWLGHVAIIFDAYLFEAIGYGLYWQKYHYWALRLSILRRRTAKARSRFGEEFNQLNLTYHSCQGTEALPDLFFLLGPDARELAAEHLYGGKGAPATQRDRRNRYANRNLTRKAPNLDPVNESH